HGTVGFVPIAWQEQAALNESLRCRLSVEALAQDIPPGLRRNPPLTASAFTMSVTEPVGHGSGVGSRVWRIEARIAGPLANAADLLNGGANLSGIISAALGVPFPKSLACSLIH